MTFFYDNLSGLSGLQQYDRYSENKLYLTSLKRNTNTPINYQLVEIMRKVEENTFASIENANFLTKEAKKNHAELAHLICGSIENGLSHVINELEDVNWRLNDINESLNNLHSMLDWKTDIIIEEQKITNYFLCKIKDLLKISDNQKERNRLVEQGIIWILNAFEEGENSEFYPNALDDFMKAKQIEEKDFFTLRQIGIIYLEYKKLRNIDIAEEYFMASARFAKAIAKASQSRNSYSQNRYNDILDYQLKYETLLEEAATSLNYASRCKYIQTEFSAAVELAKQAFELAPANPEFGLQMAKCLSANKQYNEAAEILYKVIDLNKYYSSKVLLDPDLFTNPEIIKMINSMSNSLVKKVDDRISHLKSIIIPNSKFEIELNEVIRLYYPKSYITARIASEILF